MAYRLPAHLHRNRHGVLYFRLTVPKDIRHLLEQREIYRSLNTSSVRQAADVAQTLRIALGAIFRELRTETMSQEENAPAPLDKKRINEFVSFAKQKLSLQIRLEEQEAATYDEITKRLQERKQHERELSIAIASKGGLAAAPIPDTPTISAVWERYKAEKIALGANGGWKDGEDTAKYDHWPHIRAFVGLIGDKQMGRITAEDAERFQNFIVNDKPGVESPRNKDKRLTKVGALLRWAKLKRIVADSFSEYFKYPGTIPKNNYLKFSPEDIKALFDSEHYKKHLFKTPAEYWIPLLGLFTGGRLNEIAQLTCQDIGQHEGIDTISISDEEQSKRLKTAASRRIIPIHSKLIDLGFLGYAESKSGGVTGRLFPELPESKNKAGDYGREPSRKFTDYRRLMNVGGDKKNPESGKWEGVNRKVFHSFRSTLIDALRKAGVPKERRTRLAGHEFEDTQDSNYDGGDALTMFPFKTLKADIENAVFEIDFTPYDKNLYFKQMGLRKNSV